MQIDLVSSKISFMRIFAAVRWRGALNESEVVENGDFRFAHYIFQTVTYNAATISTVV